MQETIINIITSLGYRGIGLLMFAENLFPPIPSELIMPLAGFTVAQGKMNFALAVLAGVMGTIFGALPWYYVCKIVGEQRIKRLADKYGKWITVSSKDIDKAKGWFERYGNNAVLFGRIVPGVRTLISLPAGINEMPLMPFLIYSTIGTTLWVLFLTGAGYLLGNNYKLVDVYLAPVSKGVLVLILVAFAVWIFRKKQQSKRRRDSKN